MKPAFYLCAAIMLAVALALVLVPLIRRGRRDGRPVGVFALALGLAFVIPVATVGIYMLVGTPQTLDGVAKAEPPPSIDEAMASLTARLAQHPDDLQGWLLMGQARTMLRQFEQARDAYGHALKIDAGNGVAMVGWAETDSQSRPDHLIDGRARELLDKAVQVDATNQRALWLLGISDFQQGRYKEASATWRKLQPLLDPSSNVAAAVEQQIAAADAKASGKPDGPAANATPPALDVQVAVAPALKSKLAAGDTLYVYARAENGPPMPLAVAKLDASKLPASVILTDGMGMTPQFKLSSAERVFVGARISKGGQAIAQPGDLEGDAGVVATSTRDPIRISIDRVH
ncbi:c-type cytochrome biogenesis protein CcmI/CycH [Pinirhizobacter sp.]|uniref:tetratricopeptide repeat protein n=1 Tax=Pinirhizobacter sp. TaxID=2950432 RepID=UPI002F3FAD3B